MLQQKFHLSKEQIFFAIVILLCLWVVYDYILPLALGVTLGYLFEPLVEKLFVICRFKRPFWKWVLAILVITITFLAVLGPIYAVINTGIQELSGITLTKVELKTPYFFDIITKKAVVVLEKFGIHYSIDQVIVKATEFLKNGSLLLASGVGIALSGTPVFLLKTTIAVCTWCIFIIYGKEYRRRFLPILLPWDQEREIVAHTVSSILKALIIANVLVSFLQAIIITAFLAACDIPRFALFGILSFFLSFIPFFGTLPITLGCAAYAYFHEGRVGVAIAMIICTVVVSVADHVLRPLFMKGGAQLSFFWIFLAILGGISQFGLPGAVLGPVFFALFVAGIKMLESTHAVQKETY